MASRLVVASYLGCRGVPEKVGKSMVLDSKNQ